MNAPVMLHMTTLAAWIDAVHTGHVIGESLSAQEFLHLSAPEQVHIPANALFAGRRDIWLLVIDPDRLRAPLRWEPGSPDDLFSMTFPHLYGPLNLDAVVAVVPYACRSDGSFESPVDLPAPHDAAGRALAMEWYLARARSTLSTELPTGLSIRHRDFSVSWEHNRVIVDRAMEPEAAATVCARELAGLQHWQMCVVAPVDRTTIRAHRDAGWTHTENLLMASTAASPSQPPSVEVEAAHRQGPRLGTDDAAAGNVGSEHGRPLGNPTVPVCTVDIDALTAFRVDMSRRYTPSLSDADLSQLLSRERLTDEVAHVEHLAVFDGSAVVAQADCYVVGATAQLESVETDPPYRGRGFGTALVLAAVERAHALGCDVVFLRADADDWVWQLYERLGFTTVGTAHVFDRDVGVNAERSV